MRCEELLGMLTLSMGQASSQLDQPASGGRHDTQDRVKIQQASQGRGWEMGNVRGPDNEDDHESARALLSLKHGASKASESSGLNAFVPDSVQPVSPKTYETQLQDPKRKDSSIVSKRKKQRVQAVLGGGSPELSPPIQTKESPDNKSCVFTSKSSADNLSSLPPGDPSSPINQTQISLDDIASDDDEIACLYRDYENKELHGCFDSQAQEVETDITSPFEDYAFKDQAKNTQHFVPQPQEPPHEDNTAGHGNTSRAKRKKHSHRSKDLGTSDQNSHVKMNSRGCTPEIDLETFDQAFGGICFDAADLFEDPLGSDTSKKRKRRSKANADTVNEGVQEPDIGGHSPRMIPELDLDAFDNYFANHENGADVFGEQAEPSRSTKRARHVEAPNPSDLERQSEAGSLSGGATSTFDCAALDQVMLDHSLSKADQWNLLPDHDQFIDPVLRQEVMSSDHEDTAESNQDLGSQIEAIRDPPREEFFSSKKEPITGALLPVPKLSVKKVANKFHVEVPPYVSPYPLIETQPDGRYQSLPGLQKPKQRLDGLFSSRAAAIPQASSSQQTAFSQMRNSSEVSLPPFKKGKGKQATPHREQSKSLSLKQTGPYSEREIMKIEDYRDEYLVAENIDGYQFNEMIHAPVLGNSRVRQMWSEIRNVLPNRDAKQLTKFCRRRFHNFHARGVWTPEEDEQLAAAVEEKGKSWKAVGELIERHPEDCRDRWRNYLVNAENRNHEQWTESEVRNLAMAIDECVHLLRYDRKVRKALRYEGRELPGSGEESNRETTVQTLVNWQAVSDRMGQHGGGRSRLQCSMKWSQLKQKVRKAYLRQARLARTDPSTRQLDTTPKKGSRNAGWRLRKGARRAENMKTGDKQDLLLALTTCSAIAEENIPWLNLGSGEFKTKWTSHEKRGAWIKLREEIPSADNEDYHEVANRLYTRYMMTKGDCLEDRWDPEKDDDVTAPKVEEARSRYSKGKARGMTEEEKKARDKERSRRKGARRREKLKEKKNAMTEKELKAERQKKSLKSGSRSKEFIDSSDDESDQQETSQAQGNNRQAVSQADDHRNSSATSDEGDQDGSGHSEASSEPQSSASAEVEDDEAGGSSEADNTGDQSDDEANGRWWGDSTLQNIESAVTTDGTATDEEPSR